MFHWSFSQARQVLSAPMWSSSEPLPSADRDRGPGALPAISLPAKWLAALGSHLAQQQSPLGGGYMLIWLAMHIPLEGSVKTLRTRS